MKDFEALVDECIVIFLRKMDEKAQIGQALDLGEWLHWFAFDVISTITFSNCLGFMEQGKDVNNIIAGIKNTLRYNSVIAEVPYLHQFLLGSPLFAAIATKFPFFAKFNSISYVTRFVAKQLERYAEVKDLSQNRNMDMLARFKRHRDGEQVMTDDELLSHATSNIFAGSDTTASTLQTILFNLCRYPQSYAAVMKEIDDFDRSGRLSDPVTFAEGLQMPYLQACMREALRLRPVVGQLLERVVPAGGANICGVSLPEGTVVGVNPWVVARDKSTYGDDVESFRPERWLEADPEALKLMERNNLGVSSSLLFTLDDSKQRLTLTVRCRRASLPW